MDSVFSSVRSRFHVRYLLTVRSDNAAKSISVRKSMALNSHPWPAGRRFSPRATGRQRAVSEPGAAARSADPADRPPPGAETFAAGGRRGADGTTRCTSPRLPPRLARSANCNQSGSARRARARNRRFLSKANPALRDSDAGGGHMRGPVQSIPAAIVRASLRFDL
jgi:hypothetical protein